MACGNNNLMKAFVDVMVLFNILFINVTTEEKCIPLF